MVWQSRGPPGALSGGDLAEPGRKKPGISTWNAHVEHCSNFQDSVSVLNLAVVTAHVPQDAGLYSTTAREMQLRKVLSSEVSTRPAYTLSQIVAMKLPLLLRMAGMAGMPFPGGEGSRPWH